jgi:hypothetical protein
VTETAREKFRAKPKPTNVRNQVFGLGADFHPPCHVGINAVEIHVVQLGEPRRVTLRRFNQQPFFTLTGLGLL